MFSEDDIGPILDKRISSIAPDAGVVCANFERVPLPGLSDTSIQNLEATRTLTDDSLRGIFAPGIPDLDQDEYDFDNKASSIICSFE